MGYSVNSLDALGEGYGFRKIRKALGVNAFGVNAIVFPPGYDGPNHYHDPQDELYFVHRGTATFVVDGDEHAVEEGGLVHVESTTPRSVSNRTDDDLVVLIVGGKGGYVERDGQARRPGATWRGRQALSRETDERPDDGFPADAADAASSRRGVLRRTRSSSPDCRTGASSESPTASRAGARVRSRVAPAAAGAAAR